MIEGAVRELGLEFVRVVDADSILLRRKRNDVTCRFIGAIGPFSKRARAR